MKLTGIKRIRGARSSSGIGQGDNFTIAIIPDTQWLTTSSSDTYFRTMTQYLVDQKREKNIKIALHEGDIVNWGSMSSQWTVAKNAMDVLDGELPYLIAPGNHDSDDGNFNDRDWGNFRSSFPHTKFRSEPWFHASYPTNTMESSSSVMYINNEKWLFFAIDFCPTDSTLAWARGVCDDQQPDRIVIVTHSYLNTHGNHMANESEYRANNTCNVYGAYTSACNCGTFMYNELVSLYPNVLLVCSGHELFKDAEGAYIAPGATDQESWSRRNDVIEGKDTHQLLANYQGGSRTNTRCYLRFLEINTREGEIYVTTYNPVTDHYRTDDGNQFTLTYK